MQAEPRLARWLARTDAFLDALMPADAGGLPLPAAMRYAVLGGGKRLRPLLVQAAGAATGADESLLDAPAAAVELLHAFSLVHDDLPAMDDDALRRGRATVHVAYDEATAILAGDALQALAFEVLAASPAPADLRIDWVLTLARATGVAGMCGGQARDMAATGQRIARAELEALHALKTGALVRACVRMGARAGTDDESRLAALDEFAAALGLAFQIRDDLLDVEASSEQLGKTAGKDAAQEKSTYVSLLGLEGARAALTDAAARMDAALDRVPGDRAALAALGRMAVERQA